MGQMGLVALMKSLFRLVRQQCFGFAELQSGCVARLVCSSGFACKSYRSLGTPGFTALLRRAFFGDDGPHE